MKEKNERKIFILKKSKIFTKINKYTKLFLHFFLTVCDVGDPYHRLCRRAQGVLSQHLRAQIAHHHRRLRHGILAGIAHDNQCKSQICGGNVLG